MEGGDRVSRMASCWDVEDRGSDHSLVGFGPSNDNEEGLGSLDDISTKGVP